MTRAGTRRCSRSRCARSTCRCARTRRRCSRRCSNVTTRVAEPLADPAILPTFLLARTAREHVKVILSGEGADELFGGYPTYLGHKIAPMYDALPSFVRARRAQARVRAAAVGEEGHARVSAQEVRHRRRAAVDRAPPALVRHRPAARARCRDVRAPSGDDPLAGAMLLDYRSYLRDNLLVKVDRATMLSSVEARAPYLDRDVTAFALSLPDGAARARTDDEVGAEESGGEVDPARRDLSPQARPQRARSRAGSTAACAPKSTACSRRSACASRDSSTRRASPQLLAEHRAGHANHAKPLWAVIMLQYWLESWA